MVKSSLWWGTILLATGVCYAEEFIYPVGFCSDQERPYCYLIHQASPKSLTLFRWDVQSKEVEPGLPAPFLAAGLQILPNNGGFSFIHHGRLYVQQWGKRSPKAIDFYEPITNLSLIHWLDEQSFYFSAECIGRFAVFASDLDGTLSCLVTGVEGVDCLYPQKCGDSLFYIRRSVDACGGHTYEICQTTYGARAERVDTRQKALTDADAASDSAEDTLALIARLVQARTRSCMVAPQCHDAESLSLIQKRTVPIVFLTMICAERGFFVSHPESIHADQQGVSFGYHLLTREQGAWHEKLLFHFVIPTRFLIHDATQSRLFESLYRLLPSVHGGSIYFVHGEQPGQGLGGLALYAYDMASGQTTLVMASNGGGSFFGPLFVGDGMFVGGSCTKVSGGDDCGQSAPLPWASQSPQNWLPSLYLSSGVVSKVKLPWLKV